MLGLPLSPLTAHNCLFCGQVSAVFYIWCLSLVTLQSVKAPEHCAEALTDVPHHRALVTCRTALLGYASQDNACHQPSECVFCPLGYGDRERHGSDRGDNNKMIVIVTAIVLPV